MVRSLNNLARNQPQPVLAGAGEQVQLVDMGSSCLPSEINAAFLWAQLESAAAILKRRIDISSSHHQAFASTEEAQR